MNTTTDLAHRKEYDVQARDGSQAGEDLYTLVTVRIHHLDGHVDTAPVEPSDPSPEDSRPLTPVGIFTVEELRHVAAGKMHEAVTTGGPTTG